MLGGLLAIILLEIPSLPGADFLMQLLIAESNSIWSMTIGVASFGCWNVGRLGRRLRTPKVVDKDLANLSAIAAFVVIGEPPLWGRQPGCY